MTKFNIPALFFLFFLLIFTASCSQFFEATEDVQARKALTDLMQIQEAFHDENQRYARNLTEIEKYDLKYHSGIVYMEIQSADKEQYATGIQGGERPCACGRFGLGVFRVEWTSGSVGQMVRSHGRVWRTAENARTVR